MRLRRICKSDNIFKERSSVFKQYFKNNGYTEKELNTTLKKFENMTQDDALKNDSKDKNRQPITPLVVTYSPRITSLKDSVKKYWPITQSKQSCRKTLTQEPKLVYRRNKNLKDLLVSSKFVTGTSNRQQLQQGRSKKCGK